MIEDHELLDLLDLGVLRVRLVERYRRVHPGFTAKVDHSEQEIADAKATIGRDGIGCEPASATTVAGIRKLVADNVIKEQESVVAVLTGHLLKDTDYVMKYHSGRLVAPGGARLAGTFANNPIRTQSVKSVADTSYAEVAVPLHVFQTFTYRLSPEQSVQAEVGARLVVPLGRNLVTGYVVGLHDELPAELGEVDVKNAHTLVDTEPVCNPEILQLARWVADYYMAGIGDAMAAFSSRGPAGPYQLQAAIAAVHDEAPTAEVTDWPQILALYTVLERVAPNPTVTLNRAVAVAEVQGPTAGLALLDALSADERISASPHLVSVRAHLLEMAGDHDAARAGYQEAARRTTSEPERRHLLTRAARLG